MSEKVEYENTYYQVVSYKNHRLLQSFYTDDLKEAIDCYEKARMSKRSLRDETKLYKITETLNDASELQDLKVETVRG